MKLGFVSAILPDLSLSEVALFAAEAGYRCVELMCWPVSKAERRYAGVTHVDVVDFTAERAKQTLDVVQKAVIEISGLGYYPNPLDPDRQAGDRFANHIRIVIDAAATLGIDRVNTFVGRDPAKSVDDNWPRFLEVWKPIIDHAEKKKVRVGIENCPMSFTKDEWPGGKNLATTPAIWRRMYADIPSQYFGLNYDPSHQTMQLMDPIGPIHEFGARIHAIDGSYWPYP